MRIGPKALLVLNWLIMAQFGGEGINAATIGVTEKDIVSIANAPEVLGAETGTGENARPAIFSRLLFANDCYAEAGILAAAGQAPSGITFVAILQKVNPLGCPEIFQPTERRVEIALQPELSEADVRLIGKPAPPEIARRLELGPPSTSVPEEGPSISTRPFRPGAGLPAFEVLSLSAAEPTGYTLTGRISLGTSCEVGAVGVLVYEVPNADGEPQFDVVVLTAPEDCAIGARQLDLAVTVATPQPPRNRFVYVVNEAQPAPRPLD